MWLYRDITIRKKNRAVHEINKLLNSYKFGLPLVHILPSEPFEVYKFCNTLVLHWLYPIKKEINYRYIHSVQKEKSAEIITALCSLQTVHSQQPPQFGGVLKTDCIQRAS